MDINVLGDGFHSTNESIAMLHHEIHASIEIHESCLIGPYEAELSSFALFVS